METKPLGEFNIYINDGNYGGIYPDKEFFLTTGVPFISASDFTGRIFNYEGIKHISEELHFGLLTKGHLKINDIVIVVRGNGIGKVGFFKDNIGECNMNAQLAFIRTDPEELNPLYLYYLLSSKKYLDLIKRFGTGSAQPQLPINRLKLVPITYPDLSTQQKIAAVLSALDAKIELNARINAELEQVAKTLYDYWFVQFAPHKSAGGKMVWNEALKREIPLGWEVKPLFEAMNVQYGFPFSTTQFTDEITNVPVVRIRDILENTISTYTTEAVDDKYRLNSKDLLIGMDGNFHLNFWDKDGAYLNQRSVRIRPRKDVSISNFQAYFELSPYIKAREKNISRTTVGHLSDKDLKRLFIVCAKETKDFKPKATFDALLEKIIANRLESQTLTELRDWLLPMLMNGQVTVD